MIKNLDEATSQAAFLVRMHNKLDPESSSDVSNLTAAVEELVVMVENLQELVGGHTKLVKQTTTALDKIVTRLEKEADGG